MSTPARSRRLLPLLAAGLLILAGALSLLAQVFVFPARAASPEDWRRAAALVEAEVERDDVIRVHPTWTEEPMPHLGRVGNQLHRLHHPLKEDLQHATRVWIISETARLDEALARLPFAAAPARTEHFDTVTVALVPVPDSVHFRYELLDHLESARVTRRPPGHKPGDPVEECSQWSARDRRWDCGRRDRWFYVGETVRELDDDPRHCIWAHPPPDRKTLRVEFPDVPLDHTLRIRAGLDLRGARSARGTDIRYRILLDDELQVAATLPARQSPWRPHDIDTSARRGERARVALEVEADQVFDRFFCFNGWVLGEGQE